MPATRGDTPDRSSQPPRVRLSDPVTGGGGRPYASSIVDLSDYGYTEVEYFLSGQASIFAPVPDTVFSADGRWQVTPAPDGPTTYCTRLLVRRPPKDRFNGTVVVEFMQEYFGSERDTNFRWNAETLLREGFAWVGASLHHEGIDERHDTEFTYNGMVLPAGPSLIEWDADRYGALRFPHSDLCYDVLSQIGRAVGAARTVTGVDPLPGLDVKAVIAVGNTIAADRLRHYINGVHPQHRVFDGFFLQDLTESGVSLAAKAPSPAGLWLRTDVSSPTIVLNTMTAAVEVARQPEGPNLRFWEPAGSSHTTGAYMARVAEATNRDLGLASPSPDMPDANTFPLQYISGAAIIAVHRWITEDHAAPSFPRLSRIGEPPNAAEDVDSHGNARGGLRSPWVDVPIARYDWRGAYTGGAGRAYPFDSETFTELYVNPAGYLRQFEAAAHAAHQRGVLLEHDLHEAVTTAGEVTW